MRSLPTIEGQPHVVADFEFRLRFSDQSTTYLFRKSDIANISNISWESSKFGGLGVPSTYSVSLISSLEFIKDNITKIVRGDTFLTVFVNSDSFTPHVGKVRDFNIDGSNPNVVTLQIFDRFLDSNPKFPVESIVDSYSNAHPQVIDSDFGYPVYYGKHTKPFYMTPVDCDISTLLSPRNVSSANLVNSVWYNTNPTITIDSDFSESLLLTSTWSDTGVVTGGSPFQTHDDNQIGKKIFTFGAILKQTDPSSQGDIIFAAKDSIKTNADYFPSSPTRAIVSYVLNTDLTWQKIYYADHAAKIENVGGYTGDFDITIKVDSGENAQEVTVTQTAGSTTFTNCVGLVGTISSSVLNKNSRSYMYIEVDCLTAVSSRVTIQHSLSLSAQFRSDQYWNYSIAAYPVNSSDIAVSENPARILTDIFDQSSIDYRTDQFSQSMIDTSSYNFQCFFGVRQDVSKIITDFGQVTGSGMWVGDSGYLNIRCYQNSQTLVDSDLIDATITTSDMILDTFKIFYNALGTTSFQTDKFKRVKVNYNLDYARNIFDNNVVADKNNNTFCDSIDAAGITNELTQGTPYIVEETTAGYYKDNLVRNGTLTGAIVEMELPARFYALEQNDIVKVEHPTLIGSESLFQILRINANYMRGTLSIKADEVV